MTTIELKDTESAIIFDEGANPTIILADMDESSMGMEWATAIVYLMLTDDDFVRDVWEKFRCVLEEATNVSNTDS